MFYLISLYLFIFSLTLIFYSIISFYLNYKILLEWTLFLTNSSNFKFIIYFDWMNFLFTSTIMLITASVLLYSMSYMPLNFSFKRFMLLIMIFMISMLLMIFSLNLMSILFGWDGLGLSSYCLVMFYQNMKTFNSGMTTILFNRIGDICILMMISLMLIMNSWNFMFFTNNSMKFYLILIIIASFTKSAQIPFSLWLPLAMAAPTPISALVHSSTLVTAGIYLLIRFSHLLNYFFKLIMFMSCMTMFLASLNANFNYDIKKIIALSTLSQLGLMIFIMPLNQKISFFHLTTHAMFKSLLFLCSGIIIHSYNNNQDIRIINNNLNTSPFINSVFWLSSLTISGLPFLSGFYSKDIIMEFFLINNKSLLLLYIMLISMSLTLSYSIRLMNFLSKNLSFKFNLFNINYLNLMNLSIILLLTLTLFYGSILNWLIFNNINKIYLKFNIKILYYKILLICYLLSMILSIYYLKFKNFKNLKYMFYMNTSLWMMNFMYTSLYKNIFMYTNFLKMNEIGWNTLLFKNNINMMINYTKMMKQNYIFLMTIIFMLIYLMLMSIFQ